MSFLRKTALPTCIDDAYGNDSICNLFFEKYKNLYNLVPCNKRDMEMFQNGIESNIRNACGQGTC